MNKKTPDSVTRRFLANGICISEKMASSAAGAFRPPSVFKAPPYPPDSSAGLRSGSHTRVYPHHPPSSSSSCFPPTPPPPPPLHPPGPAHGQLLRRGTHGITPFTYIRRLDGGQGRLGLPARRPGWQQDPTKSSSGNLARFAYGGYILPRLAAGRGPWALAGLRYNSFEKPGLFATHPAPLSLPPSPSFLTIALLDSA